MKPEDFYVNVEEKDISLSDNPFFNPDPIHGYKAIVLANGEGRNDEVISIVKDTYKLVQNKELIEPFLENLEQMNVNWYIDSSHSFALSNRMRMQITFPDVQISDEDSNIPLSLYLHNSYDMSEGVRVFWGAIRAICTNGMIFGKVLGSFYGRHTQGFSFENINQQFDQATAKIHKVQRRIDNLQSAELNVEFMDELQAALGKRRLKAIVDTDRVPDKSQWDLLNDITYFISHDVEKPKRADLQMKVSKTFAL